MMYSPSAPVPFPPGAFLAAPLQSWQVSVQVATMLGEAQMVVAYRVLGQMGLWATGPLETRRMFREKPAAFVQSAAAVAAAVQAGKRPDQILAAAVTPLGRRTRANMRRLARRGPGPSK